MRVREFKYCLRSRRKRKLLSIEYVRRYVCDYFNRPIECITSVSEFKKDRVCRYVFYVIARAFCVNTIQDLADKMFTSDERIFEIVARARKIYYRDIALIEAELEDIVNDKHSKAA